MAFAAEQGIAVIALTDHDSVEGLAEAAAAASGAGITLVPGIELSTEDADHEVHLLGYFLNPDDAGLHESIEWLKNRRVARVERMVAKLQGLGVPVQLDRVLAIAGGASVGRPHVARAMIEIGAADSVNDAFARYLAIGKPGYVPRERYHPEDALGILTRAKAVPVLAHPYTAGEIEPMLDRLQPRGLLGLEAYYGAYDDTRRRALADLADRRGLIATGGSDFHGPHDPHGRALGAAPVPAETYTRLRQVAGALARSS